MATGLWRRVVRAVLERLQANPSSWTSSSADLNRRDPRPRVAAVEPDRTQSTMALARHAHMWIDGVDVVTGQPSRQCACGATAPGPGTAPGELSGAAERPQAKRRRADT